MFLKPVQNLIFFSYFQIPDFFKVLQAFAEDVGNPVSYRTCVFCSAYLSYCTIPRIQLHCLYRQKFSQKLFWIFHQESQPCNLQVFKSPNKTITLSSKCYNELVLVVLKTVVSILSEIHKRKIAKDETSYFETWFPPTWSRSTYCNFRFWLQP